MKMAINKVFGLRSTEITMNERFTRLAAIKKKRTLIRITRSEMQKLYGTGKGRMRRSGSMGILGSTKRSNSWGNLSDTRSNHSWNSDMTGFRQHRSVSVCQLEDKGSQEPIVWDLRSGIGRGTRGRNRGNNNLQSGRVTRASTRQQTVAQRGRSARGGGMRRQGNARATEGTPQQRPVPTKEELDKELELYMMSSKAALDKELEEYMKNAMELE